MRGAVVAILLIISGVLYYQDNAEDSPAIELRDGYKLGSQELVRVTNMPRNPRHWLVDGQFIYALHFDQKIVQKYDWCEKRQVWQKSVEADYERGTLFLWKRDIWLSQSDYLLRISDGFKYPVPAETMNYVKARGRWIY